MITIDVLDYQNFLNGEIDLASEPVTLIDHLGGFDSDLHNPIVDYIASSKFTNKFYTQYYVDSRLTDVYEGVDINFYPELQHQINFRSLSGYDAHPEHNFKNFVCSFNGNMHVSRNLLPAILHRNRWFDPVYSSKNSVCDEDMIYGNIQDYAPDTANFYSKFFINPGDTFYQTKYSFGHVRFDHANNIYNLESKLTQSFLHIVSETMATSYYPHITEKFLYSIVTRGLFLAYAPPFWHEYLEKYYGFKKYTKLFDYRFDTIQNPIERLIELMSMISKFSVLTTDDWRDLQLLEHDTIEYNYNWYRSGQYLKHLTHA